MLSSLPFMFAPLLLFSYCSHNIMYDVIIHDIVPKLLYTCDLHNCCLREWEGLVEIAIAREQYQNHRISDRELEMEKFLVAVLTILALSSPAASAPVDIPLGNLPFKSLLSSLSESRLRGPADLECDACKIVVTALQQLLLSNSSENEIVDVITKLCIALQIEDQNVCTLGVLEFKVLKLMNASICQN